MDQADDEDPVRRDLVDHPMATEEEFADGLVAEFGAIRPRFANSVSVSDAVKALRVKVFA
jgi:hypothetical protein